MSTWIQKFIDRLFGYDFFISYAHQDGRIYPKRLQERLRDDFAMRVFLDTSIEGFVVGQELNSETRRRVQASTYLVLVARPLAIQSTWVRAEIEACLAAGRRLIVIDINETLRSAPDHHSLKGLLQKRIYVSENLPGGDGEPTATTLESLSRAFQGIRREALRLRVTGAVAIFFALLSLLAGILYVSADRARSRAVWQQRISQAGLLAEQARASLLEHPQRGLLLAIESIAMIRENGKDDLAISSPVETLQEALLSTKGSKALRGKAGSWTMDFSPDGQFLAIGSEDGVVRLWLLRQPGKLEQVWQAHKGAAFVTRFSPDGARLATAGADGLVKLLPVPGRTSKALNLGGHTGPVSTLSFSSDGQLLAAGGFDGLILIWNLNNLAAHPLVIRGHKGKIYRTVFSPDGLWLASGGEDGDVRIWSVNSGASHGASLVKHDDAIWDLAFSPSGRWLATGGGDGKGFLIPWPPSGSGKIRTLRFTPFGVAYLELSFSPDERWLATISTLSEIKIWSLQEPIALVRIVDGARNGNSGLAFSPDSRWLAVGGYDGVVRAWSLVLSTLPPRLLRGFEGDIASLQFSRDQNWIAAAGRDRSARLWSWRGETALPVILRPAPTGTSDTAFSPDGRWVAAAGREGVFLRSLENSSSRAERIDTRSAFLTSAIFSPDSRWLAVGRRGPFRLWRIRERGVISINLDRSIEDSSSYAFSSDGRLLAIGEQSGVWLCELPSGHCRSASLFNNPRSVTRIAFDPALRILAVGHRDGDIRISQLGSEVTEPLVVRDHEQPISRLAFSPDGNWLASLDNQGKLCLRARSERWSSRTCTMMPAVIDPLLSFSSDSRWLAEVESSFGDTEGAGVVRLWSAKDDWAVPRILRGHDDRILSLAFDPTGHWLATGGWDETARLWRLENTDGQPRVVRGYDLPVHTLAFDPNGKHLFAATGPNEVWIWPLAIDELVHAGCASAGRNLTEEEWRTYFGTLPYRRTCT